MNKHAPSVCPNCGSTDTAPIARAGRKWRYRCASCLATWIGKRKEPTSRGR